VSKIAWAGTTKYEIDLEDFSGGSHWLFAAVALTRGRRDYICVGDEFTVHSTGAAFANPAEWNRSANIVPQNKP